MSVLTNNSIASVGSLASVLKKPNISRKRLSRYSWLPDVLRLKGSIAVRIVGPVLTVTIFATGVAFAYFKGHNVTMSNSVTPLLAVVVGLILVFRNSTSYDRYYEGRKDFGTLISDVGVIFLLNSLIWVNVALPPDGSSGSGKGKNQPSTDMMTLTQLHKVKCNILRLAVFYAYAVKHHLRDEHGLAFEDYSGVVPPSFARYDEVGFDTSSTAQNPSQASYFATSQTPKPEDAPKIDSKDGEAHHRHHGHHGIRFRETSVTISGAGPQTPLLGDTHRTVEFHPYSVRTPLCLPLIIAHELTRSIFRLKRDGYLETVGPAGVNTMNGLVQSMVTQLTNMERVKNTPIPISYGIHLKQCVTLYLFALPFTLVRDLAWTMIPVVTVVAFTLMGIEGIADEIEMPFGTDKTDLPLDQFCEELKEEVNYIIERLPEGGRGMEGYDDGEGDD